MLRAFEQVFGQSLRQRCHVHQARNVTAKVPKEAADEVKGAFWSIFDGIEQDPGEAAIAEAKARVSEFERAYAALPSAEMEAIGEPVTTAA